MFARFRERFLRRSRESIAKNAAEGTYETIRQAVIYSSPRSQSEVEQRILERLTTRRSWRRVDANTFAVCWLGVERSVVVVRPLDVGKFFRDVTEAEIAVFSAGASESEVASLQELGRNELRRLFARDSIPWAEDSGG